MTFNQWNAELAVFHKRYLMVGLWIWILSWWFSNHERTCEYWERLTASEQVATPTSWWDVVVTTYYWIAGPAVQWIDHNERNLNLLGWKERKNKLWRNCVKLAFCFISFTADGSAWWNNWWKQGKWFHWRIFQYEYIQCFIRLIKAMHAFLQEKVGNEGQQKANYEKERKYAVSNVAKNIRFSDAKFRIPFVKYFIYCKIL